MFDLNSIIDCVDAAVVPTGTPAAGAIAKFSGSTSITNGDLTGDCTTSGALSVVCTKTTGSAFHYFATGTDASNLTGTVSVNRFDSGAGAGAATFLRGDGTWALPPSGGTPYGYNPPTATAFSTVLGSPVSFTNVTGLGAVLDAGAATNNFADVRGYIKPFASGATTWVLRIKPEGRSADYFAAGFYFGNTTNAKFIVFWPIVNGGLKTEISYWTNSTTYGGSAPFQGSSINNADQWLKVVDDGTNLNFYTSGSGQIWTKVASVGRTTWMGVAPNTVGFVVNPQVSGTSSSWGAVIPYFTEQ